MFEKILIANRGEIALRINRACKEMGIATVAIHSTADAEAMHVRLADESVCVGPPAASQSYLNIPAIIAACEVTGADAIHPGYGFLSENALFAERCQKENIKFIGPSPEAIRLMGDKIESRKVAAKAGVPVTPGMAGCAADVDSFRTEAARVGYPVLIKASAGGGGKGMRAVENESELAAAIEAAQREAQNAFGDDRVYLEKKIVNPRHIEFQILADEHGHCIHLFERECSIQRRHQKIIEETPSVALDEKLRRKMGADAVKVAQAAKYSNAGTVEFLLDENGSYYFLEMNTRLQVEHPITEMVTGIDLVAEQIKIAAGEKLGKHLNNISQNGHAIECRIYAEDADNNFMPSIGKLLLYQEPVGDGIRVDSGVAAGSEVTIDYDPIMSKLIVHAHDRQTAIANMIEALKRYNILGVKTCRYFLTKILQHENFAKGRTFTNFIETNMTNMPNSSNGMESYNELAAAAAAMLSSRNSILLYSDIDDLHPSPWQLLGDWSIGSSISG
ncbi:MAG: acetyl-CoA carboxylase biotin carboxylase subunit [candidate division Zixibacteria bacterium]|nr:acetyl-CoA carboxylase biotin carboxylase subunit [candidate division Zixibacteria bacterium]